MHKQKSKGFIKIVLLVIAALVFIKYAYEVDVVNYLTTGKFGEWLDKFYNLATLGWGKYNSIIIKIWNYCLDFVKNIF